MSRILPILFNTEMVRAILDGRKTVTRRVIDKDVSNRFEVDIDGTAYLYIDQSTGDRYRPKDLCRYQSEDILYIREAWAFQECNVCKQIDCHKMPITRCEDEVSIEGCYIYRADHPHPERLTWRPSIHMPKAAARIWIKVTDVKVERLQDITIDGIRNEGLSSMAVHAGDMKIALKEWEILWDSTITKGRQDIYRWDANPWVWVIEFERCKKQEVENV